jgi:transposase
MTNLDNIEVKTINHLGLIAGIIDEIGIGEIINEKLGIQPQERLNSGLIVKGIILNAMGFVSRPLYLFPQFFEDKATEHLLGEGILPEYFNDDKIGRVMDKLYQKGLTDIFLSIALSAFKKSGINHKFLHLDATSIAVEGEYLLDELSLENSSSQKSEIKIVHGYSRDKRPDLKQFLINLIVSGDGDVPLFFQAGNGNDSDKAVFGQLLNNFKNQVNLDNIIVADSALYSQGNLFLINDLRWITRVPLSIKAAQLYTKQISEAEFIETELEGYKVVEKNSNYGNIEQLWLIIESQQRKESDLKKLEEKVAEDENKAKKLIQNLGRQSYSNIVELKTILKSQQKSLKYHYLILKEVIPTENKKTKNLTYKPLIVLDKNFEEIETQKKQAGRFILATNVRENFSASEIIMAYKGQQASERGFAFLKDPLFFADSVFLKSPSRVETMAMLMGLALLVYTIGQRQLRLNLLQNNQSLKNQLGLLTSRPTLRWIFQGFQGIHLVILNGIKQIVNLTNSRIKTLNHFSQECQKYYLLSG